MRKKFCKLYLKRLFEYAELADHYCNYSKAVHIYNKIYILAEFFMEIWEADSVRWRDYMSRAYRQREEALEAAHNLGEDLERWSTGKEEE